MLAKPTGDFLQLTSGPLQARVYRGSGHLELIGPDLTGRPLANSVTFQPPTATISGATLTIGSTLSSQPHDQSLDIVQSLGATTITARLSFPHESVMRYEVIDWGGSVPEQTQIVAATDAAEHFYGFGERFNGFDQAGMLVRTVTFDQPGNKGVSGDSYTVAPWFVSTRGYGVHLDSSAESVFDMRATQPDRYVVRHLFNTLAVNVVYGPRLTDVLSRFTAYAGRPDPLPPFAFGPWISSDAWRSGSEVRYAVTKFRERGIPASMFVFDSPWETAYNDFTFNMTQFAKGGTFEGTHFDGFASLADMMTFLQRNGLKVMCWMTPYVNDRSLNDELPAPNGQLPKAATFDDGTQRSAFVTDARGDPVGTSWWKGHGSPIDFTGRAGRDWLLAQLHQLVDDTVVSTRSGGTESAIGGFKTDDAEALTNKPAPGDINAPAGGEYIAVDLRYADGRTGRQMRNGYCVEYQRTVRSVLGSHGVIFRAQRFHWFTSIGRVLGRRQRAQLRRRERPAERDRGRPVRGDERVFPVGSRCRRLRERQLLGYLTGKSVHALDAVRVFQPDHADASPGGPTRAGRPYRSASIPLGVRRTRPEQLPLLRSAARPALPVHLHVRQTIGDRRSSGHPSASFAAPGRSTDSHPQAHLLLRQRVSGSAGHQADRLRSGDRARGYLPDGTWFDFWTQQRHSGGQEAVWRSADQQQFPLFVRAGAIIPMLLSVPDTLCSEDYVNNAATVCADDDLHFLIYPQGDSSFTVHDDTVVSCRDDAQATAVQLSSIARRIVVQIFTAQPHGVTLDGAALDKTATIC